MTSWSSMSYRPSCRCADRKCTNVDRRGWRRGPLNNRTPSVDAARVAATTTQGAPAMAGFERVLLYIGAPKTGTTTVQNILRKSRPALMKQGFFAPTAGRGGTGQHIELPAIVLSGEQRADLDRHFNVKGETKEIRRRHFIQDLDRELA